MISKSPGKSTIVVIPRPSSLSHNLTVAISFAESKEIRSSLLIIITALTEFIDVLCLGILQKCHECHHPPIDLPGKRLGFSQNDRGE